MTKKIHRVMGFILMVFLLSSCSTNNRESIAREFLNQYYQVTEDEVLAFSELDTAQDETLYNQYIQTVKENFSNIMTEKEMDRLAKNRLLSYMVQYANENETLYRIDALKIDIETAEKNYDIFNYTLDVIDSNTSKTLTISGLIKVETTSDGDFITYTELTVPKTN